MKVEELKDKIVVETIEDKAYVHLKIMTPTNLNKNQKEYLKKFKEEESDNDNIFKKFMKNFKK